MGIVRIPKYCLHAPTGQAYVRIRGRMIYLGKHGVAASREAYGRTAMLSVVLVTGCGREAENAFQQGRDASDKGDFDLAISYLTEAIRLNPKLAEAYSNRGNAYEKKGDKLKAEQDFVQAEKLRYKPPETK